ncbi:MAG: diguanylate cyclase [Demequinaceae bacterium]|nr:diguanylate cyclase [Demequinaceae bacterium]
MVVIVLVVFYAIAIATSTVLLVLVLRVPHMTPATMGLAIYFVTSAMWAAIAVRLALGDPADVVHPYIWITVVVSILVVAVRILGRALPDAAWRPSRRYMGGLLIHPAVMIVIAMTPSFHHLIVSIDADGHPYYAVGFWLHSAQSYVFSMHAGWMLAKARKQIQALVGYSKTVLLLPWTLPIAASIFSIWQHGPQGFDFTPIAFAMSALLVGRSLAREGLASIMPVARVRVFESLKDALVVLDPANRIVDVNARALELMGAPMTVAELCGRELDVVCPPIAAVVGLDGEHDVCVGGDSMVIYVDRSPLTDRRGREVGTLVHLRDITVDVNHRRELVRLSGALASEAMLNEALRAELAEQVVRDADTGLHNRRFVFAELPIVADGCSRDGVPLSIVLLDVDRFKAVNDTYGHSAGDRTLEAVAAALESAADGALVARFGGEEFMVLLPGATTEEAVLAAEALRAACSSIAVPTREGSITVTLSAGVATASPGSVDFATLIDHADAALYDAKNGGRDRVCSYATSAALAS